eukprot:gene18083-23091_t
MTETLDENVKKTWIENIPLKRAGSGDDVANAVVFLVALLVTALLYYRNRDHDEIPKTYRRLAAAFRFLGITLILFLLFSPLLRTMGKEKEDPII